MVELSPLRQLRMGQLPKMVSWYDPRLLARIGVRTIISSVFGQYADQRLMQAVTDPAEDKDLVARYDYRDPNAAEPHKCVACDETGALLDRLHRRRRRRLRATYTMAYLLAQDSLDIRGAGKLRHGEILIMGGDQCYPQATREEYKERLLQPFNWAYSVREPRSQAVRHPRQSRLVRRPQRLRRPVLLLARQALQRQRQRHRRLAVPAASQLLGAPPALQLVDLGRRHPVLEVPRHRPGQLFRDAWREQMGPQDNLIICLAEPSWMLADLQGEDDGGELLQDHDHCPRSAARASSPSSPATGTTTTATTPTSSTCTSSRPAAAAPSCIPPTC